MQVQVTMQGIDQGIEAALTEPLTVDRSLRLMYAPLPPAAAGASGQEHLQ